MTDINVHLKSFYKDHRLTFDIENKLAEIVEQKVIDLTKRIYEIAKSKLNNTFQVNFIYAMSLHISSFLKRQQLENRGEAANNESIRKMVEKYPEEYEVALDIKALIFEEYQISIPMEEVEYLTVLLVSLKKEKAAGRIGIVVAAHGNSTATSMTQVVKQLFGSDNLVAVDMPVEMKPRAALEEIVGAVELVNNGRGRALAGGYGFAWNVQRGDPSSNGNPSPHSRYGNDRVSIGGSQKNRAARYGLGLFIPFAKKFPRLWQCGRSRSRKLASAQ
ncbi:PRD domain-containing protein [Listeria grayi]|uniref:PRD domain-containing protein n=1 Tax=Listeria grayi TaxID=1641 RepID=UPI001F1EABEF|nr:PRD domain-containing protein [Listeria grayi]